MVRNGYECDTNDLSVGDLIAFTAHPQPLKQEHNRIMYNLLPQYTLSHTNDLKVMYSYYIALVEPVLPCKVHKHYNSWYSMLA